MKRSVFQRLMPGLIVSWLSLVVGPGPSRAGAQGLPPQVTTEAEEVTDAEFHLPVDEATAETIRSAVANLGAPLHEAREKATRELITIGTHAFAILRDAYARSDDLEVRLRIEEIVREAYLDRHVYDRNGFLGIQQQPVPQTHDDDPRILEGHYGVAINRIIENTAAQDHGLVEKDVIIALDGEPLKRVDGNLNQSFGEQLRTRGPGIPVLLTVLRGEVMLDMEIPLGKRPKHLYVGQGVVSQHLHGAERNFTIWWARHFRNPPGPDHRDE